MKNGRPTATLDENATSDDKKWGRFETIAVR